MSHRKRRGAHESPRCELAEDLRIEVERVVTTLGGQEAAAAFFGMARNSLQRALLGGQVNPGTIDKFVGALARLREGR